MATYTVQSGDTLTGIAIKLGLCAKPSSNSKAAWSPCLAAAERIQALNPIIQDINVIRPGWVLALPRAEITLGSSTLAPMSVIGTPQGKSSSGWTWVLGLGLAVAAGWVLFKE